MNRKTKITFFFEKRSMKKVKNHLPCLHCFGEDGAAFICSGTFFRVKRRSGQAWAIKYEYHFATTAPTSISPTKTAKVANYQR